MKVTKQKVITSAGLDICDTQADVGDTGLNAPIANDRPLLDLETIGRHVVGSRKKQSAIQSENTAKVQRSKEPNSRSKQEKNTPEETVIVQSDCTGNSHDTVQAKAQTIKPAVKKSKAKEPIAVGSVLDETKAKSKSVKNASKIQADEKSGKVKADSREPTDVSRKAYSPNDAHKSYAGDLWHAAAASKAKKPKETQVWLDNELYRRIEMLNIKHDKPFPTKYVINSILRMFIEEHKAAGVRFVFGSNA